ncbi:MAG: rod shape-determining protein [Robiginitomaculum sp.]|nr:rod shape-determining protein [Robiginitomaculum sp.]
MSKKKQLEFIGYDLGHGETAVARAYGGSSREPEILEHSGERSFVTAVARNSSGVRIGAQAVNLAALGKGKNEIWVKFKSRDLNDASTEMPTRLFTQVLFGDLAADKKIDSLKTSRFIVGCPSGWTADDRETYAGLMRKSGLKTVRIVPESRAALMTALEQGYLSLEAARSSVLIVDIGSSTTDFTYCYDLEAEDVGHNILGSGLLDTLILERNLARQPERKKIEKLIAKYPWYRPILEYWCRLAKEQYFNGAEKGGDNRESAAVENIRRLPIGGGVLFEIRVDKKDADAILKAKIKDLNGFSWPDTFGYAVKEAVERLGGRHPQTVLLTGGASRLPLVAPACEKAFPNARVVRGAEPEFAIARGLSWLGRFEYLHGSFKTSVAELVAPGGPVFEKARTASDQLGDVLAPVLVDALIDACVVPAFRDWRRGKIKALNDVEAAMNVRIAEWLSSDAAQKTLRPAIEDWFAGLQRRIEQITDPLCRDHSLPAMVLSLDDSTHVSRHLEGLSVAVPKVTSLENDTALVGTTISAVLIGVLLAEAHLLAPLLTSPIGIAVGSVIGIGSFLFGRKALEGKLRAANIPGVMRLLLTDGRVRKAAKRQRADLIKAVATAWNNDASEKFSGELVETLGAAFIQRADERAVLFLL